MDWKSAEKYLNRVRALWAATTPNGSLALVRWSPAAFKQPSGLVYWEMVYWDGGNGHQYSSTYKTFEDCVAAMEERGYTREVEVGPWGDY